jgi:uncharacterized protein
MEIDMKLLTIALCAILLSPAVFAAGAKQQPMRLGHVNDNEGVLTKGQVVALSGKLATYEEKTSNQVVVLFIKSLDGKTPLEYATDWWAIHEIGLKDRDNGVLILASISDRAWRINVGTGLEDSLPDKLCLEIGRTQIIPNFRKQLYYEGVKGCVDAIIKHAKRDW